MNFDLFNQDVDLHKIGGNWRKEYVNMPTYANDKNKQKPEITATFKFRNKENYIKFMSIVKDKLYDNKRVFDGNQKINEYSAWYPLNIRPSEKEWIVKGKSLKPKYPIYIPTKGRFETRKTVKALQQMNVSFYVVIEPQEYNLYKSILPESQIVVLPYSKPNDHSQLVNTRNFIKNHSIEKGYSRHWQIDDNVKAFYRTTNNTRHKVKDGVIFRIVEDFVDRYTNIGMAGLNYMNYAIPDGRPPYILNSRVYSISLVNNKLPYKWEGIFNDDTDICLRMLKDGFCTINFNAFSGDKDATMVTKGGNTPIYTTGDLRAEFVDSLIRKHPKLVKKVWRYDRYHHEVNYKPFEKNLLERVDNYKELINKNINDYNLELINVNT
tara:strand:- start:272 stop:1411 length:1140 start_codon:yes stop_codon:yes gene_type:complete